MFSSSTGLFSFQFSSMDRLDAMLENGPWFIQNNPLILKKWHPDENLLKEDVSTVPVWVKLHGVPVTAFSEDGLSAIATKLGTPLMLDSYTSDMCMQSWGRSSYARVMIELRADVELKDNIVVAMPKITREGHYTCAGEKKTMKKPSQASRGVPVGPKMAFKSQKEYRHVTKKPNTSSSCNKKKGVEPTIKVSNSNPFDVLNSVDNDVEFGTNGGTSNLGNNEATPSGKLRLLDNDGKPLVPTGIVESDSEVKAVFDETANLRISMSGKDGSDKGYGTNSLLEQ
ncbi:ARID DNA-binding domain-containing protein [Tanacetum coccineum]